MRATGSPCTRRTRTQQAALAAVAASPTQAAGERPWLLQDFAFDPATMLGARLAADCSAAEETLLPLLAPRAVSLPPAEGNTDVAPQPSRRRATERAYARRPELCQVPSCGQALAADGHAYCFRFRVCHMHLRAEVVTIDGAPHRFCQKCSTFQPLTAFSGTKRTCAKSLAALRLLRPSRQSSARSRSHLAGPPPLLDGTTDVDLFGFVDALLGVSPGASSLQLGLEPAPARIEAEQLLHDACSAYALPMPHEASLKLHGAEPDHLPPSLAPALAAAWCADAALSLEAAPRPGCTVLHLDALLPAHSSPPTAGAALARALLSGDVAPWLRARRVEVHARGETATAAAHRQLALVVRALPLRPPRLLPLVALSSAAATLRAPGWAGPPQGSTLWLRLHGRVCALRCDGGEVLLPPLGGAEGVAHLWFAAEGAAGGCSCALLLTRDAAVATEVAQLDAHDEQTERRLCVLGAALCPGAEASVLAAAAGEALRLGWAATARRLLPRLRAALDAGACSDAARTAAAMMLHAAAAAGRPEAVRLVLSLSADGALGTPHAALHGVTPLHLAAATGDGASATALASASPAALLAWFTLRSGGGATPAAVAMHAGGSAASAHEELTRRLRSVRPLVAQLAGGTAQREPFDDEELARFLLHTYAPAAASDPPAPGERELYEATRMLLRRSHALCLPPFAIATVIRCWMLPKPSAETIALVSLPERMSWAAFVVYQGLQPTLVLVSRLGVSFVVLAFAGLPQLRGAYVRHGRVVLRSYSLVMFVLLPVLTEWHIRRVLAVDLLLPRLPGVLLVAAVTVHVTFIPLPLRDKLTLLAARWMLMFASRVTGAPIWPRPEPPFLLASLLFTALSVTCAIVLALLDRHAWAAWRSVRRLQLAERYVHFKEEATKS